MCLKLPKISLKYLKTLTLKSARNFIPFFSLLPRLETLHLEEIDKLNLNSIIPKCPKLQLLELINCQIKLGLTEINNSITELYFVSKSSVTDLPCRNFFSKFLGVKNLLVALSKCQFTSLLFPQNVIVLNLNLPVSILSNSLVNATSISILILTAEFNEFEDDNAEFFSWFETFLDNRPSHLQQVNTKYVFRDGDQWKILHGMIPTRR
ncbi:hypothetical protein RCL1_003113 [Eukaryota sp. TZLM3-RCL]